MNSIAIILARGGSKRLPGKNQRIFFGKPLVAWTIEAALLSRQFDRILLSTDSQEIARIGVGCGAEVPFLRDRAFDDHSSSSEATLAALDQAEKHWGESYQVVAQLMANCPLRTAQHVCAAMNTFANAKASSQISCFKFGWMNPWWAAKLESNGRPEWIFPESRFSRSQDLPDLFCPSGAIWIAKTNSLKAHKSFYFPGHVFSAMDWISAVDIDDEADWMMAEACMLLRQSTE
jgi:CMP-N-acetylneuraminic acid synthetase